MKKFFVIGLIVTFVCVVTGCNKKMTTYEEINYGQFKEKIENKDSFALFVGSSQCSHCDDYKVTLNKFITNYQVQVYYIDVAQMTNEEINEFNTVVNFGGSTPTTVFITDGIEKTVYNRIVGALPYNKVVSKFEKAGYIKEKK